MLAQSHDPISHITGATMRVEMWGDPQPQPSAMFASRYESYSQGVQFDKAPESKTEFTQMVQIRRHWMYSFGKPDYFCWNKDSCSLLSPCTVCGTTTFFFLYYYTFIVLYVWLERRPFVISLYPSIKTIKMFLSDLSYQRFTIRFVTTYDICFILVLKKTWKLI